jgi:hypothetical protein
MAARAMCVLSKAPPYELLASEGGRLVARRQVPVTMEGSVAAAPPPIPPKNRTRVHVDGSSSRIVEGGSGRPGRVELAALVLVALPESVASTTVTSVVLAIAAMITTLSLTLDTIAKGTRWSRERRNRGVLHTHMVRTAVTRVR